MQLSIDQKDIDKFLMIGDKVLIKPKNPQSQTKTGLYLPPSVQQGEKIQAGYIIKTGPGYPLPSQSEEHEVWEKKKGEGRCNTCRFKPVKVIWLSICRMPLTRSILMTRSS